MTVLNPPAGRLRVLVVDDQELFRELVVEALRRRGFAVAGCSTPTEALTIAERSGFDVACLDVDLRADETGIDLAARLRAIKEDAAIVFLTVVADPDYFRAETVSRLYGCSYLLKNTVRDANQLVDAIRSASEGRFFVDPALIGLARASSSGLTRHQVGMLRMAAQGMTNVAIAEASNVTASAVESSFTRIAKTLGVEAGPDRNVRVACVAAYLRLALQA